MTESIDPTANWSFETKQIHAGQTSDATTKARALPIYQTTSYTFDSTDHAAALFGLAEPGNIYTRIMNPTQDAVEQRIAALEGGVAALLLSSGQAAETFAVLNLAEAGDHIVSSPYLYGGTYNLFHYTLPKLGIEVSFVEDPDDLEQWRSAVRPNTKAFYGETIANPKNHILDIPGISKVGHDNGIPLIVDNTVATPYLLQPLKHGADIVVHSAPSTSAATARPSRASSSTAARSTGPGRHGNFTTLTRATTASCSRTSRPGVRVEGARAVAARPRFRGRPVQRVPHRPGHRDPQPAGGAARRQRAEGRRVPRGTHGRHIRGVRGSAVLAVARARTAAHPEGSGCDRDVRTGRRCRCRQEVRQRAHPPQPRREHRRRALAGDPPGVETHSQLTPEEQLAAGVTPGLVRLAVGIEGIDDILADLETGFAAAAV